MRSPRAGLDTPPGGVVPLPPLGANDPEADLMPNFSPDLPFVLPSVCPFCCCPSLRPPPVGPPPAGPGNGVRCHRAHRDPLQPQRRASAGPVIGAHAGLPVPTRGLSFRPRVGATGELIWNLPVRETEQTGRVAAELRQGGYRSCRPSHLLDRGRPVPLRAEPGRSVRPAQEAGCRWEGEVLSQGASRGLAGLNP